MAWWITCTSANTFASPALRWRRFASGGRPFLGFGPMPPGILVALVHLGDFDHSNANVTRTYLGFPCSAVTTVWPQPWRWWLPPYQFWHVNIHVWLPWLGGLPPPPPLPSLPP